MRAKVSPLYKKGVRVPREKKICSVDGDLNLSVGKNPVTGRCVKEACVLTDHGGSLLPDLFDVECISIAAYGMRLRGVEFCGGREVAQEWWCVILPPDKGDKL